MTAPARAEAAPPRGLEGRARAGSIAGAVAFATNLVQAVVLVPVLMHGWGAERYGLWLALQSLFALVTTLDSGHHTFVGNELLRLYPTDRGRARAMLGAGLLGGALLGGLELLVCAGLVLTRALPWGLGQADRPLSASVASAFALLIATWVAQGAVGGVWARLYPAAGEYARSVWWGIAFRALQTSVLVAAVLLGADILGAVLATSVMTAVYVTFSWRDVRRRFAALYPFWQNARGPLALSNLARSLVITGCALAVQLQQHGILFMLSGKVGLSIVPAFTTTRTLANVFLQASAIVTGPLSPEMVRLEALGEHRKLADTVRAIWFVTGAPVNLGLCLGLPLFAPLYRAWTGGTMAFDAGLFAWLALAISLRCVGAPLTTLIAGLNALRAQVWIAGLQSVLVLGVLWLAIPRWGLGAAGLAVALGELAGSVVLPVVLMARLGPEIMQRLPLRTLLLALAPSLVVGTSLIGAAQGWFSISLGIGVAVGLLLLVYSVQWLALGTPMQARLLALVRRSGVS
jgi:O-antigen/teichoic acid export membrane protein